MRISALHPFAFRDVAASQMPSHSLFSLSPATVMTLSNRAPLGLIEKTYPVRPS
jgi:hypothetical protein